MPDLAGRYTIKVYTGGLPGPFTGVTDADGYFFIPFIPDGQPFTAVATDSVTGDVRTFEGVGRPVGESVYIFFDFFSDDSSATNLQYDSNVSGRMEAADIYTFKGVSSKTAKQP